MFRWRTSLANTLQQSWQSANYLSYLLWPLSIIYRLVFALRSAAYRRNFFKSYKASVPVIVVGNITVGGTGKTPMVIYLIEQLRASGYKPGVISRGYSGNAESYPLFVTADIAAEQAGDEPALIVRRTAAPMSVGPNRQHAIEQLMQLADIDIIISDDGLQHLALQRDIEICLMDATREQKNHFLLPAGPYRESRKRLQSVDFIVSHQSNLNAAENSENQWVMKLETQNPVPLASNNKQAFKPEKGIHAVAGIGNPQRFFASCESLGWQIERHAFDDHHQFQASDITFDDGKPVLMTEKDAVKCIDFASQQHWYLPVNAKLNESFMPQLLDRLKQ